MKQFKLRASCSGKLAKPKGIGKTGETYLDGWVLEQIYNRKKIINSKYFRKGNENEQMAIDMVCEHLKLGMLLKNETEFENSFFTGTPDVITGDFIIDTKCSWDFSTFPLCEKECPNDDYYSQLQVYMNLTGLRKSKLAYVLTDTPTHEIEKEAYYYCKNNGYDDLDMDIYEEFKTRMTYPEIPMKNKIKIFDINYDENHIAMLEMRVISALSYINNLLTNII